MAKAITKEVLRDQLSRREIAPVYVLYGTETYLRDLAAATISKLSFSDGEMRDFNEDEFDLATADQLRRALAAAEQLPMMASRRVIRVTNVRVAAQSTRDTLKEDDEAVLRDYLGRPSPSTVLVFVADELSGNRKISKLLLAEAVAVEFTKLADKELYAWAQSKFASVGARVDGPALSRLLTLVGSDLQRLNNEIEKLATAALPDGAVTLQLVDDLSPNSREISNFDLTDKLISGKGDQAIVTLRKILDDGTAPLALVGLLSYNLRKLVIIKDMMDRGSGRGEVTRVAGYNSNDQDRMISAARRTDAGKLAAALKQIAETDVAIKTSVGGSTDGPKLQIEMLLAKLSLSLGS